MTTFVLLLALPACNPFCGPSAFDREIRFDAGVQPITGPPSEPLDVYAIRLDDTASFSATAHETYFGDSGCSPRGPLEPPSTEAPGRYEWSTSSPGTVSVDQNGLIRGQAVGEAVLRADAAGASGSVRVRVVPSFAALRITPAEATVVPGDTIGFVVEAVDESGEPVAGVNFRTAGLMLEQPQGTFDVAVNSVYSRLDSDPVRFVFVALAPGDVPLVARARVIGASHITAHARLRVP